MASRLISSADLLTADFPEVADTWALQKGITTTSQEVTSAAFSFTGDITKFYLMNSTEDQVVTINADLDDTPIGAIVTFIRMGTGEVTITGQGSVIIHSRSGSLVIADRYGIIRLLKIADNIFLSLDQ